MVKQRVHKTISIRADEDRALGYETDSLVRRFWKSIYSPILNAMPASTSHLIKKSSEPAANVIENKTSHEALETLYNCGQSHSKAGILQRLFRRIWFGVDNSRAVRNRLKLVEREIKKVALDIFSRESELHILSIASGSARSVVTAISQLKKPVHQIYLSFLDRNPNAIEYSKRLVRNSGLNHRATWFLDTANNFPIYFSGVTKPNLIEMVGLLDYFADEQVLKIFRTIYANLQEGGYLITANISDNHERPFVSKIIGWHMIYRSAEQLIDLAHKAGFDISKMKAFYEPLGIHCVLVAQK